LSVFKLDDEFDPTGDIRQIADDAGALDATGSTRRNLIKRAGIGAGGFVAAGSILGGLSPMEAFAATGTTGAYGKPVKIDRRKVTANDVRIGNYALTLEYIEAAFYKLAAGKNYADKGLAQAANILAQHEQAHVDALKKVLGKAAVKTPAFNADVVGKLLATQESFITAAASVEPVGTAAYAGAGPYLSALPIVKAALSIHSVEANHAAYTAQLCIERGITKDLNGATISPVPNEFNPAFSFAKTIGIVSGLKVTTGALQPK
jgi:hypothetical protein